MVRVSAQIVENHNNREKARHMSHPHDLLVAWRVRDALARHPLLAGAMANITVCARREVIILEGWVADNKVGDLILGLATQAAGHRMVAQHIHNRAGEKIDV